MKIITANVSVSLVLTSNLGMSPWTGHFRLCPVILYKKQFPGSWKNNHHEAVLNIAIEVNSLTGACVFTRTVSSLKPQVCRKKYWPV